MELLEVTNLTRCFGGLTAVDKVSFTVKEGTIKGVIGPNGAGKTTLFNCIAGSIQPDSGNVFFNGEDVTGYPPHLIASRGISRTFQNIKLFNHMTVLENVMIGQHVRSRGGMLSAMLRLPHVGRQDARIRDRALAEIERAGITDTMNDDIGGLSFGTRRSVELARALAAEPSLLLLDEPAAGLNIHETAQLGEKIRSIRDSGTTVLMVEHDMSLMMDVADEILVLSFGKKIAEGPPREIQRNEEVIKVYLGEEEC